MRRMPEQTRSVFRWVARQSLATRVFCNVTRLLALALLVALSTVASANAGLDLAVLVDRSTSMARRSRSDALFLRMTLDLLTRNAGRNRVEHRMAVIGFGSSATVEMPFTPIRESESRQLRRRIDALREDDRGDTDVFAALVVAERLFRVLPASPERRRAIVLLTDGVPYVRGVNMNSYRENLRRFITTHFAGPGITIDVLVLDSRNSAMWRDLARVDLGGRAPDQLLPRAYGVIARLVGTRTAESAPAKTNPTIDTLVVPPYLDMIVFDIFRASADSTVEVFSPGSATPIRAGVDGIESMRLGDVLTTLVVPRPPPGEWTIRKSRSDAHVRILSQQFFPRGTLLRPSEMEPLHRCDRVSLAYGVLDGDGRPFAELREYALSLEVTLAKPGGTSTTIAMEHDPALGPGVFRSAQELVCDATGRYWTDVRITTVDANGRRLDVFRDRWSGFSVAPAAYADCRSHAAETRVSSSRNRPQVTKWVGAAFLIGAIGVAVWIRRKTKS